MSYLDQGHNNSYCKVIKVTSEINYAIFLSPDGAIVTCEKSPLSPGIYRIGSEVAEIDQNIVSSIDTLYNRVYDDQHTITTKITVILGGIVRTHLQFYPILEVPKMTKILATNLTSIKEALVLYETDDDYRFLCFGYRRRVAEILETILEPTGHAAIFLFPDNFFTACSFGTRFKADKLFMISMDKYVVLTNDTVSLEKISFLGKVEWQTHSDYIERDFVNGQ